MHRRDQRLTGGASLEAAELLRCNNDDFVAAMHGDVLRSLAAHLAHKLAKARFGILKNPKSGAASLCVLCPTLCRSLSVKMVVYLI